jgi:gamma-glutamylcyclotransferase (GGCT)/AIG2-like uncharacterized protein YtfP
MRHPLFAYGTLMLPALVEALLGRRLPARPARLDSFARYRVRGRPYPGIVAEPGAATEGVLLEGLTPEDLRRLDAFEGPRYQRCRVEVTAAGGARLPAETYVIPETGRSLLTNEPWSREHFERHHLLTWARSCARGCAADEIDVG